MGVWEGLLALLVTHFHVAGVAQHVPDHVLQHVVPGEDGVHAGRPVREVQRVHALPQVGVLLQKAVEVVDEQRVLLLDLLNRRCWKRRHNKSVNSYI